MVSFQLVADPCASTPCHHGNCSSSSRGGYLCICNEGYEGPNCEQGLPSLPASGWTESMTPRQLQPVPATQEPDIILPRSQATVTLPTWQPKTGQKVVEMKWDQVEVRTVDCICKGTSAVKIISVAIKMEDLSVTPLTKSGVYPSSRLRLCVGDLFPLHEGDFSIMTVLWA